MEATSELPTPSAKPARRRTDADRLADMQAELARLQAAGESRAAAAEAPRAEADTPKPARARVTRGRPKAKHVPARRDEDELDAELRDLVEGFVAALRDVIRRELIAQATKRIRES